ncbi:unnamed protein product [Rhizopus stolonifer]
MNYLEKEPLLPITIEEGPCRREYCQNRLQKSKKMARDTFKFMIFMCTMVFFFYQYNPRNFSHINQSSLDEIKTCYSCHKPNIPYNGVSSFSFKPEDYQKLKIEYRRPRNGRYLNIISGETTVSVDNSLSDITVDVEVKFSHGVLQDLFSIETAIEDDKYTIYLDNKDIEYKKTCAEINIKIRVPNASALEGLFVKLTNNGYVLMKNLIFKELSLITANGSFEFKQGISVGHLVLNGSNSSIKGTISSLSGDVAIRTSNGSVDILVQEATTQDSEDISIVSSNGHIDLQLVNHQPLSPI